LDNEFALGIDKNSLEICALNNVEIFTASPARMGGFDGFVDGNRDHDGFNYITLGQAVSLAFGCRFFRKNDVASKNSALDSGEYVVHRSGDRTGGIMSPSVPEFNLPAKPGRHWRVREINPENLIRRALRLGRQWG
jgi:hypothetical protein